MEVINPLDPWLWEEKPDSPVGFDYAYGGEIETSVKANESVMEKVPIGALIIMLLLVGQFNFIRRPLIILMTIPLGLIGVVFGLLVAKSHFGFMTFLGVISLTGIVINNAVVLLGPARAVVESAQRRLRPILLTTCTRHRRDNSPMDGGEGRCTNPWRSPSSSAFRSQPYSR